MQDLIAVVELSTGVTLVGAVVLSAWPNIKNRIGDYHTALASRLLQRAAHARKGRGVRRFACRCDPKSQKARRQNDQPQHHRWFIRSGTARRPPLLVMAVPLDGDRASARSGPLVRLYSCATPWAHFQGGDVDAGAAETMIDDLLWWTTALKTARDRIMIAAQQKLSASRCPLRVIRIMGDDRVA
jgi:hypothetical protein